MPSFLKNTVLVGLFIQVSPAIKTTYSCGPSSVKEYTKKEILVKMTFSRIEFGKLSLLPDAHFISLLIYI